MSVADFGMLSGTGTGLSEAVAPAIGARWELPVEHLSPSSLNMIQVCPRQFQQRYVLKRRESPGQAQALGQALHSALAFNFRCKIHTDHDLAPNVITEYYDDNAWPKMLERYGGPSEIQWDADPEDVREQGRLMATAYLPTAERIIPESVELEVTFDVPGVPVPILGFVDLVQADNRPVVDWKTSKAAQRSLKPEWRLQGRIYQLATGRDVDWHILVKSKAPSVYTSLEAPDLLQVYNEETKHGTIKIIQDLAKLAQHYYNTYGPDDDWPALGLGHLWRCGKYCSYSNDCPAWMGQR